MSLTGSKLTALLLIAHGSRRAEANRDLEYVAEQLRARKEYAIVECSYLELAEPNIEDGAERCVRAGADRVVMLPYFLSAGVHVAEDLEKTRQLLSKQHVGVSFHLAGPIGRHPLIVDIISERALAASEGR
jgi:sirohydrochlorin ferrochelatase